MELFTAVSKVITDRVTNSRSQLSSVRDPNIYHRGDWVDVPGLESPNNRAIVNSIRLGGGPNGSDMVYAQLAGESYGLEFAIDSNLKEKEVQIAGCKVHGFNYFSDTITQADYARIHEWVEHFWPESGTVNFARFMGFVKNMYIEVDSLWSDEVPADFDTSGKDYYPYLEVDPRGTPNYLGGSSFLTSHVQLRYDALENPNPDLLDIFLLFYYIAPIHLVLERIVAEVRTPPIPYYSGAALTLSFTESAVYDCAMDGNITAEWVANLGPIILIESSNLFITDTVGFSTVKYI